LRRFALAVVLALLASAAPLSGQNALVQGVSPDVVLRLDCELQNGKVFARERAVITPDSRVAWCASPDYLPSQPERFEHIVLVDGERGGAVVAPSCAGQPLICHAPAPAATLAALSTPGQHNLAVGIARLDAAGAREMPAAVSRAAELQTVDSCTYIPPGGAQDTRPIGHALQGFNLMAGQAARIGDLRRWGWRVEWQFDPGSERLFLMAWCVGSAQ
jgi:hypothetical protein